MRALIDQLDPYMLTVVVSDWKDFYTSFAEINWANLWNQYCIDPQRKITVIQTSEPSAVASTLSANSLLLDHTLIYKADQISAELKIVADATKTDEIERTIYYLGFTMDEYNMIFNSWRSLQSQPLVYSVPPKAEPSGSVIVCGSGPSLDDSLDFIKENENNSLIIACASNYRTLRKAGIEVDVLCLLERGEFLEEQYTQIAKEYGTGKTLLLASVTTPVEVHELFRSSMVYFRPALTPLSLFAQSMDQVLIHEGPQTINTGVALARVINAKQIILAGVDLGTVNCDVPRSRDAVGESPREFEIEVSGNLREKAFTNNTLIDGQRVLERMAVDQFQDGVELINASDGIRIEGWTSMPPSSIKGGFYPLEAFDKEKFEQWWYRSRRYDMKLFQAMWKASRPRAMVFDRIKKLRQALDSTRPRYPNLLFEMQDLLSINQGTKYEQLAARIIRGGMIKALIAAQRQMIVMADQPDIALEFEERARNLLKSSLNDYYDEIIMLFDKLESLE